MAAEIEVCPVEELPPGEVKIVHAGELSLGIYNLDGEFYCIEDRCSHDDGPLAEGDFDVEEGYAVCPRHGAHIDIRTGRPLTPVRLKCALLGLTTLKLALHKAKGTPLPEGLAGFDELELT